MEKRRKKAEKKRLEEEREEAEEGWVENALDSFTKKKEPEPPPKVMNVMKTASHRGLHLVPRLAVNPNESDGNSQLAAGQAYSITLDFLASVTWRLTCLPALLSPLCCITTHRQPDRGCNGAGGVRSGQRVHRRRAHEDGQRGVETRQEVAQARKLTKGAHHFLPWGVHSHRWQLRAWRRPI